MTARATLSAVSQRASDGSPKKARKAGLVRNPLLLLLLLLLPPPPPPPPPPLLLLLR